MWAILGGSGFESFEEVEVLESLSRETPFGLAASGFKRIKMHGVECLFMSRHGERHELLPSEINYRANIYALKQHGVDRLIAFSAVGSLRKEIQPGNLVIPNQYINFTRLRQTSFCGKGIVGHASMADPIWQSGAESILAIEDKLNYGTHFNKVYICIEGPTFSTRAESHMYRAWGADIIGMTGFPEYVLAREAGICYLPCCFVTDYDSWDTKTAAVTLQQVINLMKKNNEKAFLLLAMLLKQNPQVSDENKNSGLKNALMTKWELIPKAEQEWLKVILK